VPGTSDHIVEPIVSWDDRYFWDGVAEHRLLIQRCAACGALRHPPSPMCGSCGSLEWDTQDARGSGRVLTWILSRHPNAPDEDARVVVLVELDEGVRVVSNLVDVPADDPYAEYDDMTVMVDYREHEGVLLPVFHPIGNP
jgi:3-oxo-4,17-pregnadiene-20-carboxyl-CoA hydratase alpha subunit